MIENKNNKFVFKNEKNIMLVQNSKPDTIYNENIYSPA